MNGHIIQSKVLKNLIIATIFSALAFAFIVYVTTENKNIFIQSYKTEQQILVNEIAKESKVILEVEEQTEDFYENIVVEEIIKKAETSGSRYWLFTKNDMIIFNKNDEITLVEKGSKFGDLEKDGYITSFKTFNVKNNKYVVSINTKEDYIIKIGEISNLNNSIYLFSAIFSMILITGVIYFSSKLKDKDESIEYYKGILKKRNIIIEESTKNILENEIMENPKDDLTKVYTEEILFKILDKINKQGIIPVSILIFQILGLDSLNDKVKSSIILQSTAGILREIINEKHVIARRNNDEFVIILLESSGVEQSAFRILDIFNNKFHKLNIELLFGISKRDRENQEISSVLNTAIANLEKKKLHSQHLKERIL